MADSFVAVAGLVVCRGVCALGKTQHAARTTSDKCTRSGARRKQHLSILRREWSALAAAGGKADSLGIDVDVHTASADSGGSLCCIGKAHGNLAGAVFSLGRLGQAPRILL